MRIILLGSPGAGKGTLAAEIDKKYPVAHISTGDIFRENVKNNTPLGLKARSYMDAGKLVPDDIVIAMMEDRLREPDCEKGFILDGFPRTVPQAKALEKILEELHLSLDKVVLLDVDEETVVKRLSGRRTCRTCGAIYNVEFKPSAKGELCEKCGGELYQRDDDREDVIRKRLRVFYDQTAPVISYYEGKHKFVRLPSARHGHSLLEELETAVGGTE
ncbi:MAG: adenylate kinase [Synergistales bacterium]|nr:adenylate kinase [Synergistales bacterium]